MNRDMYTSSETIVLKSNMVEDFPCSETFHEESLNDIYLTLPDKHDFMRSNIHEMQNINADWKDLPLNTTYVLKTLEAEKMMYDDISDTVYAVQIITIQDKSKKEYRLLCPRPILDEIEECCFQNMAGSGIFFQKVSDSIADWTFH